MRSFSVEFSINIGVAITQEKVEATPLSKAKAKSQTGWLAKPMPSAAKGVKADPIRISLRKPVRTARMETGIPSRRTATAGTPFSRPMKSCL